MPKPKTVLETPKATYREFIEKIKELGFEEKVAKEAVDIAWSYDNIELVISSETEFICPDYCSASLASGKEDYKVITGKTKVVDEKKQTNQCGPDVYKVDCYKLALEKGTVVVHYWRWYPGGRGAIIYVNP